MNQFISVNTYFGNKLFGTDVYIKDICKNIQIPSCIAVCSLFTFLTVENRLKCNVVGNVLGLRTYTKKDNYFLVFCLIAWLVGWLVGCLVNWFVRPQGVCLIDGLFV